MTKSLYTEDARTKRRNGAERRFRAYGAAAIGIAMVALVILLTSVVTQGIGAFRQTYISVDVPLPEAKLDKSGTRDLAVMSKVTTIGYAPLLEQGLVDAIAAAGIQTDLSEKDIGSLISKEAPATVRDMVLANPDMIGSPHRFDLLADGRVDGYFKGRVTMASAALDKNTSPEKLDLADKLVDAGIMRVKFNWAFLTAPDASDQRPEAAGLGVAILGSLYMMIVVLVLALPIGVAASIYLEEFAPKNRWTDVIEV
ncbi:MAG: DUF3333 domain-containing protein, partial [Alphaproteobacteria bacterium]|nr:DUF3333 domain-containing protein [Alphaproteobacteria bacterium]